MTPAYVYACLIPDACKAKTPGKFCVSCRAICRNRTPGHQELARSPEANAKRSVSIRQYRSGWCPAAYLADNRRMISAKVPIAERKRLIAELQQREENAMSRQQRDAEARREQRRGRIIRSHETEMDELSKMVEDAYAARK